MNDRDHSSHAVIAGTGRAGTSFLVKFFDACGLETSVDEANWHERARAGFEHSLSADGPAPYVVKDPWLFAYCEELDLSEVHIDALIVPIRELSAAAESRIHQERMSLIETWARQMPNVQVAGSTPGGALYSLDVVDQARILAVGFHRLLHWAVSNELPVFLLTFPRFVEDPDYLLRALWPWLGEHCTIEAARRAFEATAEPGAVRVARGQASTPSRAIALGTGEPDPVALDRAALVERIDELTRALATNEEKVRVLEDETTHLRRHAEEQDEQLRATLAQAAQLGAALGAAERKLAGIGSTATWRLHERLVQNRWLYRPARRIARMLAR